MPRELRHSRTSALAAGLAVVGLAVAMVVFFATQPSDAEFVQHAAAPKQNSRTSQTGMPAVDEKTIHEERSQLPAPAVNWETRLDDILTSDASNSESVRQLLTGFNQLPAEAQEEYMAHALNLCEDEAFSLIESVYVRADTSAEVRAQIFDDALNRPDELKLPLMVRTVTDQNHPLQSEAREILCLYLDLEPTTSMQVNWDERIRSYLQETASEE